MKYSLNVFMTFLIKISQQIIIVQKKFGFSRVSAVPIFLKYVFTELMRIFQISYTQIVM